MGETTQAKSPLSTAAADSAATATTISRSSGGGWPPGSRSSARPRSYRRARSPCAGRGGRRRRRGEAGRRGGPVPREAHEAPPAGPGPVARSPACDRGPRAPGTKVFGPYELQEGLAPRRQVPGSVSHRPEPEEQLGCIGGRRRDAVVQPGSGHLPAPVDLQRVILVRRRGPGLTGGFRPAWSGPPRPRRSGRTRCPGRCRMRRGRRASRRRSRRADPAAAATPGRSRASIRQPRGSGP